MPEDTITTHRKFKKLTLRQQRFANALVEDPTSLAQAAIRAGYSKKSARYIGYKLMRNRAIQDVLRHHFTDKQDAADKLLVMSIKWAERTLDPENTAVQEKDRAKAAKWVLDYVKVSVGVLGLTLPAKSKPFEDEEMTTEELIAIHKNELEKLERVREAELRRAQRDLGQEKDTLN